MEKISWFIIILSAVLLVVMPGTVQGMYHSPPPAVPDAYFNPPVKIPNPEPRSGSLFGFFTSGLEIDGDIVIISDRTKFDRLNSIAGVAYLFNCSEDPCVLLDTLHAGNDFGYAVGISDSNVLVGAPGNRAAYLYDCEDAIDAGDGSVPCEDPIEILPPEPATANGSFGYFVAISGNTIVISETSTNGDILRTYNVFIYTCDGGICDLEDILSDPDGFPSRFGSSVTIDEDLVVVGDLRGHNAYFYDCTNFPCSSPERLIPNAIGEFGWTTSISGDTVVVANRAGVVNVYDCSTTPCTFVMTLSNQNLNGFGYDVDIYDENILVSDFGANIAFLFDSSTGELLNTFSNPGVSNSWFGSVVAISETNLIIGAQQDTSDSVPRAGAAYYYTKVTPSQQIDELILKVTDLAPSNLKDSQINGLIAKLNNVNEKIEKEQATAAINQLYSFINQMNGFVKAGKIPSEQALLCIDDANTIVTNIQGIYDI